MTTQEIIQGTMHDVREGDKCHTRRRSIAYFVLTEFTCNKVFEAFTRQEQSVNKRHSICINPHPSAANVRHRRRFRRQRYSTYCHITNESRFFLQKVR